ncbi:MAG TPA: hypothetical protein VI256_02170 [Roseiarcus sp.]
MAAASRSIATSLGYSTPSGLGLTARLRFSVCDFSAALEILSLLLLFVALGLSWRQQARASKICLAFSVTMQSVFAFTPTMSQYDWNRYGVLTHALPFNGSLGYALDRPPTSRSSAVQ